MNNLDSIQQDIASLPPDTQQVIFDLVEVLKKRYSLEKKPELLSETKFNQVNTLKILKESGLIGCISAENDLSTNYKTVLREELNHKYDHH